MEVIYIRKCLSGKSYVAAADPGFPGLGDQKSPLTGDNFEEKVSKVGPDKAEFMGINFAQAVEGIQEKGLYFGRFKTDLGATVILGET